MMAPVNPERKMPVMAMMPHVVMVPMSTACVMSATVVSPTFDRDDRLVEIIGISLRNAARQWNGIGGCSEQHRARCERQKCDCSHDFLRGFAAV
jgi:hypothetical protein